jgi:flagellar biosynthetic protein FliR
VLLAVLIAWSASPVAGGENLTINSPEAAGVVLHEVLVGLSIGFVARLVFAAMEMAGEIIGLQMGLNFAVFFDPASNAQSSAMARLFGHMTALMFVVLNGHLLVLAAVVDSYQRFPISTTWLDVVSGMRVFEFGAQVFAAGFWLAMPLTVLMLLINLALGIVSRVAPQMNFFALGFPITLGAGLGGLALVLPLIDRTMLHLLEQAMRIIQGASP